MTSSYEGGPVILVDDNRSELNATKQLLEEFGYEVLAASDEEGAIILIKSLDRPPSMVIIDYHLGTSLGPDVLQRMRANTQHHLPAGYLSGDMTKKVIALRQGGALVYLPKPLTAAVLEEMRCYIDVIGPEQIGHVHPGVYDELTGIFNRRGLNQAGENMLANSKRKRRPVGCIAIDMDNLKPINDNISHSVGDMAIKFMVSSIKRIAHVMRNTDVVARIGGDEFIILLPDRKKAEVDRIAQHLEHTVAATPFALPGGGSMKLTITTGTSFCPARDILPGRECLVTLQKLIMESQSMQEKRKQEKKKPIANVA